jgi:hypothetical protein
MRCIRALLDWLCPRSWATKREDFLYELSTHAEIYARIIEEDKLLEREDFLFSGEVRHGDRHRRP